MKKMKKHIWLHLYLFFRFETHLNAAFRKIFLAKHGQSSLPMIQQQLHVRFLTHPDGTIRFVFCVLLINLIWFVWFFVFNFQNRIRELKTNLIGKLVSVDATVTRTTEVKPELLTGKVSKIKMIEKRKSVWKNKRKNKIS